MKRALSAFMFVLLLVSMLTVAFNIQPAKAGTIIVPIDYAKIQWAIGNASDGDRIEVRAGVYFENIIVDKRVTLIGESMESTTIDGSGNGVTVRIIVDNVSISGFEVTNGNRECIFIDGNPRFCTVYNNTVSFASERGISLSGANHSVHDNIVHNCGKYGAIDAVWSHNNTIFNNAVYSCKWWGVSINNGTFNQVYNNTIYSDNLGIHLDWTAHDNLVFNNTFSENDIGIAVGGDSNKNNLLSNKILRNSVGVSFASTSNNYLRNNILTNNSFGFAIDGDRLEHYMHDIDVSNTIDGKPIRYLVNQYDVTVPSESACIVVVNSTNITVKNLVVSRNGPGVLFAYSNSSTIENVTAVGNGDGIGLVMSSNNTVINNNVTNNFHMGPIARSYGIWLTYSSNFNSVSGNNITNNGYGIRLYDSSSNSVSGNNITANNRDGIWLSYSSNCSISGNNITNNWSGIYLGYSSNCSSVSGNNIANNDDGIWLSPSSSNNSISGNNITANNWRGIELYSSSGNSVSGNNITANNGCGIWLYSSSNLSIFHNNFINNAQQAYSSDSVNVWDDGYPSGGNYWSDYTGVDVYRGSNQNETGSDAIGDTPYDIEFDNEDSYPLMKPFPWDQHDIGVTSLSASKTVCGQGYKTRVNAMVFNYGESNETLNVTAYANETIPIEIVQLELAGRTPVTVNFTWNTTGFAFGNYSISAHASPVEGETDTTDNTMVDGWVTVSIPGDINGDKYVNAKDAVLLGSAFYPAGMYNPNADINDDGYCNAKDAIILGTYFGQNWS